MAAVIAKFTIDLEPQTKKNGYQIIKVKGHYQIYDKKYKQYETAATPFCPYLLIKEPVNVEAHYYRSTRRRVDISNLHSALHDLLVHSGTLEDDNCSIVVSTDGSRVHYDKDHPRTEVVITVANDYDEEFVKKRNKDG